MKPRVEKVKRKQRKRRMGDGLKRGETSRKLEMMMTQREIKMTESL